MLPTDNDRRVYVHMESDIMVVLQPESSGMPPLNTAMTAISTSTGTGISGANGIGREVMVPSLISACYPGMSSYPSCLIGFRPVINYPPDRPRLPAPAGNGLIVVGPHSHVPLLPAPPIIHTLPYQPQPAW